MGTRGPGADDQDGVCGFKSRPAIEQSAQGEESPGSWRTLTSRPDYLGRWLWTLWVLGWLAIGVDGGLGSANINDGPTPGTPDQWGAAVAMVVTALAVWAFNRWRRARRHQK